MIFPTTNLAAFMLLVLALVCGSSWANLQKYLAKGRWRFEFYYLDFALGILLTTAAAAYSFGSMNPQELTFQDNFLITGLRKMVYAGAAGVLFNIGCMLLVAATSVAGMAVSFIISFGVAALLGAIFAYVSNPHTNAVLAFGGVVLFAVAVAVAAYAYILAADSAAAAAQNKPLRPDPRIRPPRRVRPARAIILSVIGGVFIGCSRPLVDWAREGDNGVSPYGIAIIFGGALFGTALVALPFFINFPVQGVPVEFGAYFRGKKIQHIFGILSGVIWAAGSLGAWVSLSAPTSAQPGPALTYAFVESAAVLAGIWGLLIWKDLSENSRSRMIGAGSLVLFAAGIGMVSASYLK